MSLKAKYLILLTLLQLLLLLLLKIKNLVRQVHYDAKISEMKNKYFTTSYHNKFSSDDKVAEITHKKLVNESNLNKKLKNNKKKATKAELESEQDKIVKLQT